MSAFSFPCRNGMRQALTLATVAGLALLVASATLIRAAESKRSGDREAASKDAKPQPPKASMVADAKPDDDFGPPGPPRDQGKRRPRPPRAEGGPDGTDERQPGPPPGPDGARRRPGDFGPGPPFGPQQRGPRQDWPGMERNDPEMSKLIKAENDLDRRTREAVREYREASKDQRVKLKADLKKLVTDQFEARQQRRKLELTRFEEEVKRLRDAMDLRQKNSQEIIDKRVLELLGEDTELDF